MPSTGERSTGGSRCIHATPGLCANLHGFSLAAGLGPHAAVRCGAEQRKQFEHLCRYITRPAIANERLKRNSAGQEVLQLKSAYQDGATQVVMSPLEFMQRLAALVPGPRLHLIRFHGVLAPNAKLRAAIVPPPAHSTHAAEHAHHSPARMSWARLLKRVFDIDIEHCSNCGGALKIIAAIEEPPVIAEWPEASHSSPIWVCLPGHRRAHLRAESISSKRPERRKRLPNARRRSRSACARANARSRYQTSPVH